MPASIKHLTDKKLNLSSLLAKWKDGLFYTADVIKVDKTNKRCFVCFEDGSEIWLKNKDLHIQLAPDQIGDDEDIVCSVCDDGSSDAPNEIIICDICQQGYHQKCHNPPVDSEKLDESTTDDHKDWYCSTCLYILNQSDNEPTSIASNSKNNSHTKNSNNNNSHTANKHTRSKQDKPQQQHQRAAKAQQSVSKLVKESTEPQKPTNNSLKNSQADSKETTKLSKDSLKQSDQTTKLSEVKSSSTVAKVGSPKIDQPNSETVAKLADSIAKKEPSNNIIEQKSNKISSSKDAPICKPKQTVASNAVSSSVKANNNSLIVKQTVPVQTASKSIIVDQSSSFAPPRVNSAPVETAYKSLSTCPVVVVGGSIARTKQDVVDQGIRQKESLSKSLSPSITVKHAVRKSSINFTPAPGKQSALPIATRSIPKAVNPIINASSNNNRDSTSKPISITRELVSPMNSIPKIPHKLPNVSIDRAQVSDSIILVQAPYTATPKLMTNSSVKVASSITAPSPTSPMSTNTNTSASSSPRTVPSPASSSPALSVGKNERKSITSFVATQKSVISASGNSLTVVRPKPLCMDLPDISPKQKQLVKSIVQHGSGPIGLDIKRFKKTDD